MAEGFKSKYAGKPGSLKAIRVDYPLGSAAFEPLPRNHFKSKRHTEVKKFASGLRIGEKADWNSATFDELHPFPQRPNLHSLCEFQGTRLEYNYRALELPQVNKSTVFVRKPNKMQIDQSLFLTSREKAMLVKRCPGTAASLSRAEMQNTVGRAQELSWNVSVQLDDARGSIFKKREYKQYLEANRKKHILNDDAYVTPEQRLALQQAVAREEKLRLRETASAPQASSAATIPLVFKMSNIQEWWQRNPTAQGAPENSSITSVDQAVVK